MTTAEMIRDDEALDFRHSMAIDFEADPVDFHFDPVDEPGFDELPSPWAPWHPSDER